VIVGRSSIALVVSSLENDRRFSEKDVNFADSMEERLDRYKADTYVSTSQINWLNDLEQRVRDHGL
jgi:hypothetical protein